MTNLASVVEQLKKVRDRAAKEVQRLDSAVAALGARCNLPSTFCLRLVSSWALALLCFREARSAPTTFLSTAVRRGQFAVNAINHLYISPSTSQLSFTTPQTPGIFPANCFPIAEATTDAVG